MQNLVLKKASLIFLVCVLVVSGLAFPGAGRVSAAGGNNVFYVATNGKSNNDGSSSHPWDLQTALNQPASVHPGATIYVKGGSYKGSFTSKLNGTSSAPIKVKAAPGERAILVNSGSPALCLGKTSNVYFWGLEITGPNTKRSPSRSESTYGVRVNQGAPSSNIKFINMIIHDVQSQGIGWWQALQNAEIYGSLFYFNGTTQLDHGIYAHNASGSKLFKDNIVFDNASHGFHGYAETNEKGLNNFTLDGNTLFENGAIGYTTSSGKYGVLKRNILMGGLVPTNNAVITNNYTYYSGKSGASLNLGYKGGSKNARVQGNYFMGGTFDIGGSASSLAMAGNAVYAPGGMSGFKTSSYSNNKWLSAKPGGVKFFVRSNQYDQHRANFTIYNWAKQNNVSIPGSALKGVAIKPGQSYELHNVQNYF